MYIYLLGIKFSNKTFYYNNFWGIIVYIKISEYENEGKNSSSWTKFLFLVTFLNLAHNYNSATPVIFLIFIQQDFSQVHNLHEI